MGVPANGRVTADDIALQLCETRDAAFTRDGWFFELKLDGFRLLAAKQKGKPRLVLRRGRDATDQFPEVAKALSEVKADDFILDGELVIQDERGHPIFQQLLKRSTLRGRDVAAMAAELPAVYFAFDLLALDGVDLRPLPLRERKAKLQQLLGAGQGRIALHGHIEREGEALFAEVKKRGLEGIVGKRADAPYRGERGPDWVKVAIHQTGDFAVVGYDAKDHGSLMLAVRDGDHWASAGRVGSGLNPARLKPVLKVLEAGRRKQPVSIGPNIHEEDDEWTEPKLVVEVRYKEWPAGMLLRQPTFLRFRDDKAPEDCTAPTQRRALPAPQVKLSNPKKVLWPADGIAKQELYDYYRAVSPWLLPYLKDRPLMLTRYPDGITGKNFFQRSIAKAPAWVRTAYVDEADQIVCDDLRTLEWIANLAAIPLHVPANRAQSLDRADWCVIDLDPKTASFDDVITLALATKRLCDQLEIPSYPKTTGSSGLHVMIPLGAKVPHETAVKLAEILAAILVARHPKIATVERVIEKRQGRVYVDCYQNGLYRLIASPLCVRPLPGAPVSMPLTWDEVKPGLSPRQFTLRNAIARLESKGDPMAPVLSTAIDLEQVLPRLAKL
jgi:bifunctional non-homologous end joining protein LigD